VTCAEDSLRIFIIKYPVGIPDQDKSNLMINGIVIPVAIERRKRLHTLNSKRKNNTTVVNVVNELAIQQQQLSFSQSTNSGHTFDQYEEDRRYDEQYYEHQQEMEQCMMNTDYEEGLPQQDNNDVPQTENCKERNLHEELAKIILFFDGQINQLVSTLNISQK
jgi:hypothetical protein